MSKFALEVDPVGGHLPKCPSFRKYTNRVCGKINDKTVRFSCQFQNGGICNHLSNSVQCCEYLLCPPHWEKYCRSRRWSHHLSACVNKLCDKLGLNLKQRRLIDQYNINEILGLPESPKKECGHISKKKRELAKNSEESYADYDALSDVDEGEDLPPKSRALDFDDEDPDEDDVFDLTQIDQKLLDSEKKRVVQLLDLIQEKNQEWILQDNIYQSPRGKRKRQTTRREQRIRHRKRAIDWEQELERDVEPNPYETNFEEFFNSKFTLTDNGNNTVSLPLQLFPLFNEWLEQKNVDGIRNSYEECREIIYQCVSELVPYNRLISEKLIGYTFQDDVTIEVEESINDFTTTISIKQEIKAEVFHDISIDDIELCDSEDETPIPTRMDMPELIDLTQEEEEELLQYFKAK